MQPIADELKTIKIGDKRLDKRAVTLLSRLAQNPQASIPAACQGWSETDAAYKFLANRKVNEKKILRAHAEATVERCAQEPVVLVVQDSTELDYTHQNLDIAGLGVLDHRGRRGMIVHVNAAFTPEGCCLGLLGAEFLNRDEESISQARQRANWPIEQKESFRWLQGYRQACDLQRRLVNRHVISIADREADIYEIFVAAASLPGEYRGRKADFIVRAKIDRALPEWDAEAGPWCHRKLWPTLEQCPERFRRVIELTATPKRKARTATVSIRATQVTLHPPYRSGQRQPEVTVNAVLVQEIDPPPDVEAIEWVLITSLPIGSNEEIERVVGYYRGRWPIEPYFRTLKTGCRVEQLQLEEVERLKACVALYLIVAWRVQFVTMLGRECPNLPVNALFHEAEWKSVWHVVKREPPPRTLPLLQEFLPLLASLGGYLNRRSDPPPGPKAMWIAMQRMGDYARAWITFGPTHAGKLG
jgi:hypothetical protein